MRATGIVRQVDDLGRIVLPKSVRDQLGIKPGTPVEFAVADGGCIVLKPPSVNAKTHALLYALNAVEEHLMGAWIDWEDVRNVIKRALET